MERKDVVSSGKGGINGIQSLGDSVFYHEHFQIAIPSMWLMQGMGSLVFQLLKARYFFHCKILDVRLGPRPSFSWRSIWRAYDIVLKVSWWLVGNEEKIKMWGSR